MNGTRDPAVGSVVEVFTAFLKLGLTSFGGPIAHLGNFHREFIQRRRWLDEAHYAQLVALCQVLPGPASGQLGFALGLIRAGWAGAFAAFIAFTLPSALLLVAGRGTHPPAADIAPILPEQLIGLPPPIRVPGTPGRTTRAPRPSRTYPITS